MIETVMASRPQQRQRRQGGAILVVTLVALVALLGVGALAMLAALSEIRSSAITRFDRTALYAAESGVAAGLEHLRGQGAAGERFSALVTPDNAAPLRPDAILGNGRRPGAEGNPFAEGSDAWYEVTVLNNPTDPGLADGRDLDATLVLRSVGHGPGQTQVMIEVEVRSDALLGGAPRATGPFTLVGWRQVL